MKDEHDKRTLELIPEAKPVPQGRVSAPVEDKLDPRIYDAQQRARLAMETWLPASLVAKQWGVTSRRIRALLASGRLNGRQHENGYWEVCFPYTFTEGRRGPPLRRRETKSAPKKPELRLV